MIAPHQEVDTVVPNQVDEAMLLGDPSRPDVGPEMLDRFGLPDAVERVTHDCLNKLEEPERSSTISLNPKLEVLPELILEDGETRGRGGAVRLPLLGGQARSSGRRWTAARRCRRVHVGAREGDGERFLESGGDELFPVRRGTPRQA